MVLVVIATQETEMEGLFHQQFGTSLSNTACLKESTKTEVGEWSYHDWQKCPVQYTGEKQCGVLWCLADLSLKPTT